MPSSWSGKDMTASWESRFDNCRTAQPIHRNHARFVHVPRVLCFPLRFSATFAIVKRHRYIICFEGSTPETDAKGRTREASGRRLLSFGVEINVNAEKKTQGEQNYHPPAPPRSGHPTAEVEGGARAALNGDRRRTACRSRAPPGERESRRAWAGHSAGRQPCGALTQLAARSTSDTGRQSSRKACALRSPKTQMR